CIHPTRQAAGHTAKVLVKSIIDKRYPLNETAEALRYLEEGHARGKVVISVSSP
ncbi:MAG: zinc-binding dehydrogenase, partial [Acidobacteria bacterium]|nr:zinc-binding dehydrogenase [Acidobacteriota bacterium]